MFILLPNNKLRTQKNKTIKILRNHRLIYIIKLPDIFSGMASTGEISIFWFKAHNPQNNENIIGFHIKEDGLETIKNQGRHDVNKIWENDLEPYWEKSIKNSQDEKYNSKKIIDPNQYLEYPQDYEEYTLFEEDFEKTVLDRVLFENPEISKKIEKKWKDNPKGLTHNDWIIYSLKNIKEL